ncbi:MAG: FecR domain-containing protein [Elusimicrobia bacterium]|nr:FecR domain-containing protein [Elusimicrobiota bacterium]
MGKLKKFLGLLVVFTILYSLFSTLCLYASGKITSIRGTIKVNGNIAKRGKTVFTGDIITVGPDSRAIVRFTDGSITNIYRDTTLAVEQTNEKETVLKMLLGKLRAKVRKFKAKFRGGRKFALKTPTAICAVRGTEFSVEVSADGKTAVEVYEGIVGARNIKGIGDEVTVYENQKTEILMDQAPSSPEQLRTEMQMERSAAEKAAVKKEVGLQMTKEEVQAAAAEEMRLAEYQEGKTLVDVFGKRVRLEEYIMRPAANQFKFVVLNERDDRFDYFYYKGTFNTILPDDLSVALNNMNGKLGGTAPVYYLTEYEKVFSNTNDNSKDTATGGHLVKIEYNDDGTFTITDNDDSTNTRTVDTVDATNGAYDPTTDTFDSTRNTAPEIAIYNPDTDNYDTFSAGQTLWKTRFNTYVHSLNSITKQWYLRTDSSKNILVSDLDGYWIYPAKNSDGGTIYGNWGVESTESTYPDGDVFHHRIKVTYYDDTFEQYDNYIISDDGIVAGFSDFENITTGTAYKQELLKWNYQQVLTATEFGARKIDLVVEPKIFIKSGLIQ